MSPTETKATRTRSTILECAVDLASTEGLEGLTIGRLASELGMSKSGLFAHFGSKEELQLATIDAAAQRFYVAVVAPALEAEEGCARLTAYCERYLDYLEHEVFAGGCFWAATAAEFDDRPGVVRDAVRAGVAGWLGEIERQATVAGVSAPAELAFEIYSLGLGANVYSRLLGDGHAFERARAAIERRMPQAAQ
ncbi:MAG TPA: TetR/AcrR family transcriptional regulator [Solirubrobacteraceae bacterium]|nr:TetR/AcrR family transcriptional regulator [Solirubrobacteraceae bacterium]